MASRKTPVNKQVRVLRMPSKVVFAVPTPPPTIIGYVVRYERGGSDGRLSVPLSYTDAYGPKVLLIDGEEGTIFRSFEDAQKAVVDSINYQNTSDLNLRWNAMYGDYLIDPVITA